MEQLIFEIKNKKYLLVEIVFTEKTHKATALRMSKLNCIYQGVKEISNGRFFATSYMIFKFLIPEENIEIFKEDSV